MPRAMLGYTKKVLQKVSFDIKLFCEEIKKAVKRLLPHEIEELREYVINLSQKKPQLKKGLKYIPSYT
ncbi:MAG: hypothetical protein RI558_08410 [Psychroflexus sp.]|jgi:hypothetical protein|nr:hypothetical protein [Psychroflexus sp.]MDR9449394.1 hypothetical protein [Psychroflexus sp.]